MNEQRLNELAKLPMGSMEAMEAMEAEVIITVVYSRVHKRWQSFFSKILKEPSIVQKKMIPHIKGLDFSPI